MLRANGASGVFIDGGAIAGAVRAAVPEGFDKVLELVGVTNVGRFAAVRETRRHRLYHRPGRQ